MQIGQRVRLVSEIEIDWCGALQPGLTGVVVSIERDGGTIGQVQLEDPHPWFEQGGGVFWVMDPKIGYSGGWANWEVV